MIQQNVLFRYFETCCNLQLVDIFLNGKMYSQVDGLSMACPFGPTLTNFFSGTVGKPIYERKFTFFTCSLFHICRGYTLCI